MTTRQASGAELSDSGASPTRSTTLEKAEDSAAESEIRPKRRSLRQASQEKTETSEPGKSPTNRKTSPEHKPSESDPGTCPKRPKVVQDKPDPGAESSPTRHIAKGLTTEGETPEKVNIYFTINNFEKSRICWNSLKNSVTAFKI